MKKILALFITLTISFFIPCTNSVNGITYHANQYTTNKYIILIDINEFSLSLINKITNKTEKIYPIAIGSNKTPSPIGNWIISNKALKSDAFGGYWLGLNVPWGTFGIHGTNHPESIGNMASSGCFRLHNNHIKDLFYIVDYGTPVIVYGGPNWLFSNYTRNIKPKDKGTDVYHVQRRLKDLGYFTQYPDGIYNYSLEIAVMKYKKDNNLPGDTELDKIFLDSIGLWKFD